MGRLRWHVLPSAPERYFASAAGFPRLIAQVLFNRGLVHPQQIEAFLAPGVSLCGDPFLMPDMPQAVNRVYRALLGGDTIAVYGDYDTDGVTATALLVRGLRNLGATAIPYIPHRMTEGYGLNTAALEKLQERGARLVISVDCGITAVEEVRRARKRGLDIVITDHHTPLDDLPPAVACVDAKRADSAYPFPDLTGCGVALKLLQALSQAGGREGTWSGLLDLAAMGTVADIAPLLGENRYIVTRGLAALNEAPRPGIGAMVTQAKLTAGRISSETIAWALAPRLNCAGRLAHAMTSYNLLMTESPAEAQELSSWLERKNQERQQLTGAALSRAREQVLAQRKDMPLLIASDAEFPGGVCGLVAGRLAEEFYRPAVVVRTGPEISGGSVRSIPEFNAIRALNQCQGLLVRYGGHSQAAGFTVRTRELPRLYEVLLGLAGVELSGVELQPRVDIDAEVALSALGGNTFSLLQKLAPFGQGNPVPAFLIRRVSVAGCRTMGDGGQHLRLKLSDGGVVWDAVGFNLASRLGEITSAIDIVSNLEIDRWEGNETLRLNLLDFAKSG